MPIKKVDIIFSPDIRASTETVTDIFMGRLPLGAFWGIASFDIVEAKDPKAAAVRTLQIKTKDLPLEKTNDVVLDILLNVEELILGNATVATLEESLKQ